MSAVTVKTKKVTLNDETLDRIIEIYKAASPEDHAAVAAMVARAVNSPRAVDLVSITPATAAILFMDHNKQNRAWQALTSLEYADQIIRGEWQFTNQGIGFLTSGYIADGQFRLAAIALSGIPLTMAVAYGLTEEAISTLDTGRKRLPWDATHILHKDMTDQILKVGLIRATFGYLLKATKEQKWKVRSGNKHVVELVLLNEHTLEKAIALGTLSVQGIAKPTLKKRVAQGVAFLCLMTEWPEKVIAANLSTFQAGIDMQGEESPFFVVAKMLERDATKKDKATVTAQYAATIKAFQLNQLGAKAVRAQVIREAMKSSLPNPMFSAAPTTN